MQLLLCCALLVLFPKDNHATQTVGKDIIDPDVEEKEVTLTPEDFAKAHTMPDPDANQLVHGDPTLEAGKFEGDIAGHSAGEIQDYVTSNNREQLYRNAVRHRYRIWPDGHIPYTMSSRYGSNFRRVIASAMEEFHTRTCIRFVPRSTERNYVYIHPDRGCYSFAGVMGGLQNLSLDNGCTAKGTVMHELMHASGFFHEQSRADRDQYVTIVKKNLKPEAEVEVQFKKYSLEKITHLGTEYDYGSIMHYNQWAFSRRPFSPGGETILAKSRDPADQRLMGNRRDFSKNDVYKLNKLYKCETELDESGEGSSGGRCANKKDECTSWAGKGYCDKFQGYMKTNCPKSCGLCNEPDSRRRPSTTRRPPTDSGRSSTCKDKNLHCNDWIGKKPSFCTEYPNYMQKACAKSCKSCSSTEASGAQGKAVNRECKDLSQNCAEYSNAGGCQITNNPRQKESMGTFCRKTCGLC